MCGCRVNVSGVVDDLKQDIWGTSWEKQLREKERVTSWGKQLNQVSGRKS